jgi:ABC-type lipoprotein release transport system permease subunit
MTALGVALVAMILSLLLGCVGGLRASLLIAAEPGNWILLSRATNSEAESYISVEQLNILRTRAEIAVDQADSALISPEVVIPFNAALKRPATEFRPAYLRGVRPIAYRLHSRATLLQGRWPTPGREEIVIGCKQAARFPELGVGSRFRYGRRTWSIVGIFSDHGSTTESEFWADLDVLQQDARFENAFSSLRVKLRPGTEDSFKRALSGNARLTLDALSEQDYYSAQAKVADRLRNLILVVAALVGIGAAFGGMNTMYAAVARRKREVGVLRALGFQRGAIQTSFMFESVILGLAGGLLGDLLAIGLGVVTHLGTRLMSAGVFVFSSRVTLASQVAGIAAAGLIGIAGGTLPALSASRLGVVESLREP